MRKTASKPATKKLPASKTSEAQKPIRLKIMIDVTEETHVYYANFFELGHSDNEFMLNVARVPPKPSAAQMRSAAEKGALVVTPEFQVLFTPQKALAMLKVMKVQIESYEAKFGPINQGEKDE